MKKMRKLISLVCAAVTMSALAALAPAGAAEEPSPALSAFSDWAAEDITAALELGFVPEELQGNYTQNITRQEFVHIAMNFCALQYRLARNDPFRSGGEFKEEFRVVHTIYYLEKLKDFGDFTDCSDDEVSLAARFGLVNGVGDNRFEPDREINRAEAAAMLLNAYRVYTGDLYDETSTLLADAPALAYADSELIAGWAQAPAALMTQWGVMKGVEDHKFDPTGFYTREQCIVTFMRMWRQAPISRGRTGISTCPFTWSEMLDLRWLELMCERNLVIENDFCGVLWGYDFSYNKWSDTVSRLRPFLTVAYKTGGRSELMHLIPIDSYSADISEIAFGEEPYLLEVSLFTKSEDDRKYYSVVLNMDTVSLVSITETEEQ